LPFTRDQFEAPIHAFGKGVESSLAAFSAGYDASTQKVPSARKSNPVPISIGLRPVSVEEQKEKEEAQRNAIAADD
ncbi:hypothetical protein ACC848_45715, partial [Rhizobium johnstonii]